MSNEELKKYQKELKNNDDDKKHFINSNISDIDSDSGSESEIEQPLKIVSRKKKSSHIDTMLMEHLISQQKAFLKAKSKIYKLRNEIDTEEVKTRYIKLDLNNAQVKIDELNHFQKKFYQACIGCFVLFFINILGILY